MVARPVPASGVADQAALTRLLRTPSVGLGSPVTIAKAAVAGSLAFAIAAGVGPSRYAALAPVVAVFTVQGSVLGTLAQGLQRALGTVLGVTLTVLFVQRVGTSWWSILVSLLVSLLVARRLPIGFAGQAQIPVSVLLTMALGPSSAGYGQWRIVDSLLGGVVGIAVGVLVPERPDFGAATQAQHVWGNALADQLDAVAAELEQPPRELVGRERHGFIASSSALLALSTAGQKATALAQDGVDFNPFAQHHRDQLDLLRLRENELVRVTLEIRVLSLTVDQLYDRQHHSPRLDRRRLAELLHRCAQVYRDRRAGHDVLGDAQTVRAGIAAAVTEVMHGGPDAYAVLDSVSLLGRLEQLRADLSGRHPADADPADLLDTAGSEDPPDGPQEAR
jgi:uncharacterized membrane protein YccC